jgi:hypothetical protein
VNDLPQWLREEEKPGTHRKRAVQILSKRISVTDNDVHRERDPMMAFPEFATLAE